MGNSGYSGSLQEILEYASGGRQGESWHLTGAV